MLSWNEGQRHTNTSSPLGDVLLCRVEGGIASEDEVLVACGGCQVDLSAHRTFTHHSYTPLVLRMPSPLVCSKKKCLTPNRHPHMHFSLSGWCCGMRSAGRTCQQKGCEAYPGVLCEADSCLQRQVGHHVVKGHLHAEHATPSGDIVGMAGSTAVTATHLVQATHVKATRAHPLPNASHIFAEKLAADSAFCMKHQ